MKLRAVIERITGNTSKAAKRMTEVTGMSQRPSTGFLALTSPKATRIFRQAQTSLIFMNVYANNEGMMPNISNGRIYLVAEEKPE